MGTEEIFPSLFTIVFPTEDGGVSKEDDTDGNDVRTDDADIGRECCHGECYAGERLAIRADHAEHAGGGDGKAGDGADYDGIDEGTGHGDVALSCRVIRGGSCGGNRCRAKAGFIGEAAARYAIAHRIHDGNGDGTNDAAFDSRRIESHHHDEVETMRNVFDVKNDAGKASQDVEDSHAGNNDGRNLGDRSDTADDDSEGHDSQDCAHDLIRYAEGGVDRGGDRIRLRHVADTEGSKDSEESESSTQEETGFFVFEAVLHGEHRAALHFTLGIHFTELEAEHTFRELGRKAEACGDPHPDQSARAAGEHRRRDTDDITCTDGRSKRSHQRRERRNVTASDLGRAGLLRKDRF